jgi:hypothetical protein
VDDTIDGNNEGKDRVRILCGATGPVAEGCVPRVNALSTMLGDIFKRGSMRSLIVAYRPPATSMDTLFTLFHLQPATRLECEILVTPFLS